jgi:signal transduction histidine kinase
MPMRRCRWWSGLRARMAFSYVAVTVASVLVLELLALGIAAVLFLNVGSLTQHVEQTARYDASSAAAAAHGSLGTLPPAFTLGDPQSALLPGQIAFGASGVQVPDVRARFAAKPPIALALLIAPNGQIAASTYPARYSVGSRIVVELPESMPVISAALAGAAPESGAGNTPAGRVIRAVAPVRAANGATIGAVYVHVPAAPVDRSNLMASALPLLGSAFALLLLIAPVGALFGLLTTRGLVRRLRRLSGTSAAFAGGDFARRVPVMDTDEIGQLEYQFNAMAGQLVTSMASQRDLAEQNARLAERSRITRELHDNISQDLFSLSMFTDGLQAALPPEAPLQRELAVLEQTVGSMMREMRALLLELRPTTFVQRGLPDALKDIMGGYGDRLGITFSSTVEPLTVPIATELAVLRIAQEGIANAVRHAQATAITLSLTAQSEHVVLVIADNGKGLDTVTGETPHGLGLRLMHERVRELHGELTVDTTPGAGTRLQVSLPREGGE